MSAIQRVFSAVLAVGFLAALSSAADDGIVADGLKIHFDAATPGADPANTWSNLVGGGSDATLLGFGSGTKPVYVSGAVPHYSFTRNDTNNGGYARVAGNPLASDGDVNNGFTIEGWVRWDTNDNLQVVGGFDKSNQSDFDQVGLRISTGTGADTEVDYRAYRANSSNFERRRIVDDQPVSTGQWEHVVMTWDGTAFQGFKNGQAELTYSPDTVDQSGIDEFLIGAKRTSGSSPSPHMFAGGDFTQVRVYDDPLSVNEVQQNYIASQGIDTGFVASGLKVHLDGRAFNNTDSTWLNLAPDGADAAMTNATLVRNDPTGVAHYEFNGSSTYGRIVGNPLADTADVQDGFTIEVWVRPQDNTAINTLAGFDKVTPSTDQVGIRISDGVPATDSTDYYAYRNDGSNGFDRFRVVDESPEIPLDSWVQIVLTWDGLDLVGYKNGVQQLTVTNPGLDLTDIDDFLLGAKTQGTSSSLHHYLDGELGLVRVYDDPLSQAQVQQNFFNDALYFQIIPEPTTLLIWSLLAALAAGLGWRRKT